MNACEDQSEPLGEGPVDTLAVIEHGAARRFWRGADEVLAVKQLAERQSQALNAIRELHRPVEYYEYDTNGVFKTDADGERILMGRVCRECSTDEFLEILGDCEIEDSTHYEGEVAYPCATIRAIDEAGA